MSDSQKPKNVQPRGERRKNGGFDYEGAERRRVQRIKGIVVEFTISGSKDAPQGAFLRDMSLKGLSISVVEKFKVGTVVNLSIYLTDIPEPATVEAEVRWVRISEYFKEAKREHYDVGLMFTVVEDKDFKALETYINRYSR